MAKPPTCLSSRLQAKPLFSRLLLLGFPPDRIRIRKIAEEDEFLPLSFFAPRFSEAKAARALIVPRRQRRALPVFKRKPTRGSYRGKLTAAVPKTTHVFLQIFTRQPPAPDRTQTPLPPNAGSSPLHSGKLRKLASKSGHE